MRNRVKTLSRQTISTAVFEYLKSRGFEPDRKWGVDYFMDEKNPMVNVLVRNTPRNGK